MIFYEKGGNTMEELVKVSMITNKQFLIEIPLQNAVNLFSKTFSHIKKVEERRVLDEIHKQFGYIEYSHYIFEVLKNNGYNVSFYVFFKNRI